MKRAFIHIGMVIILMGTADLAAQQLPVFSQYILNGFMVNPAFAGHDGFTSFNLTARQQWLGFKGAPQTYSASWQTRVLQRSHKILNNPVGRNRLALQGTKGRVGLGAYVINDANANVARTGLSFTYAYHIIMNNRQLSFGLALKAFQYRIMRERLTFGVDGDPVMNNNFKTVAYSPDADFGVLYRDFNYFIGFSVSNLLQTSLLIGANELSDFKTYRHYWLMGGYRFEVSNEIDIEPTCLIKTSENWNPQGEATLKLYYNNLLWGGISYRTNNSLIALVGVRIDGLFFGYSFDWTLSEIGNYSYGSHEITLSAKLGDDARRYRWLNRY